MNTFLIKSAKITVGMAFGKYDILKSSTFLYRVLKSLKRCFFNYFGIFDSDE